MFGPSGVGLCEFLNDVLIRLAALARRMPKAAGAHAILNVKNPIVTRGGRPPHGDGVEAEPVTDFPSHDVIGARGIAADSQCADEFALVAVKRQPAAEHDYSADRLAHHGVVLLTEVLWVPAERNLWVGRRHDAIQRLSRLRGGIHVAGGE